MIHSARIFMSSFISAGLLAALLLFSAGCSSSEKEAEPLVTVQTTPAERATISETVSAEAVVYPVEQAIISPKITAPITEFKVQRGSRVKKGQVLAVLESRDLAGQAEASKGNFEQADAGYVTSVDSAIPQQVQKAQLDAAAAKAAFDAQQRLYDSRKELLKEGAIPQREVDAAEVALAQARSVNEVAQKQLADLQRLGKAQALKSAHGSRQTAEGQMRTAEAQLSYSEIRSPINGVIADRPLYPGEMAAAGTPLLTVMDVSQIIARAHIPQPDAALLKLGDKAAITAPGDDQPTEGKITVISPALDPNSTTVEVWVQAKNPEQRLKPGTSVQLSMLARTIPDALVIPAAGLLTAQDGTTSVMLVGSDNRAHQKPVKIGVRQADQIQIIDGVRAGDRVVASGAYGLPDNTRIKAQEQRDKGSDGAEK